MLDSFIYIFLDITKYKMGSSIKNFPLIIYYELMKNYASVPYVPASIQLNAVSVYAFASLRT